MEIHVFVALKVFLRHSRSFKVKIVDTLKLQLKPMFTQQRQ